MAIGTSPGRTSRVLVGLLPALCAGLVACASSQPAQAAKADFNGAWTVKLCDKANPKLQCGSFDLYLVQRDERICGQHFVSTPGLSRLDEGDPSSVLGTFDGSKATVVIENTRDGAKYLATAQLSKAGLRWHLVGAVTAGETPPDSVIPADAELTRNAQDYAKEQWEGLKDSSCRWPDEIPDQHAEDGTK